MVDLVDEEQQHRQHDHHKEAPGAGQEADDLAHIRDLAHVLAHDVAIGDDVLVGKLVVVALGGVAVKAVHLVDGDDAVGVERVLIVDDGMERDDVAYLQRRGVALLDDDQVVLIERGRHGLGLNRQRGEPGKARNAAVVFGGERGECEQRCNQDDDPHDNADHDGCSFFNRTHFDLSYTSARSACRLLLTLFVLLFDALETHGDRVIGTLNHISAIWVRSLQPNPHDGGFVRFRDQAKHVRHLA